MKKLFYYLYRKMNSYENRSISFDVNNKLNCQSVAYDFVFDKSNNPLKVEISYGFAVDAYDACPGHWDSSLQWHEGKFNPQW